MKNNGLHPQFLRARRSLAICKSNAHPIAFLYPAMILCIFGGLFIKETRGNYLFLLFVRYQNRIQNALMLLSNNLVDFLNIIFLMQKLFYCIRHINTHCRLQAAHPQYMHLSIPLMFYYLLY